MIIISPLVLGKTRMVIGKKFYNKLLFISRLETQPSSFIPFLVSRGQQTRLQKFSSSNGSKIPIIMNKRKAKALNYNEKGQTFSKMAWLELKTKQILVGLIKSCVKFQTKVFFQKFFHKTLTHIASPFREIAIFSKQKLYKENRLAVVDGPCIRFKITKPTERYIHRNLRHFILTASRKERTRSFKANAEGMEWLGSHFERCAVYENALITVKAIRSNGKHLEMFKFEHKMLACGLIAVCSTSFRAAFYERGKSWDEKL